MRFLDFARNDKKNLFSCLFVYSFKYSFFGGFYDFVFYCPEFDSDKDECRNYNQANEIKRRFEEVNKQSNVGHEEKYFANNFVFGDRSLIRGIVGVTFGGECNLIVFFVDCGNSMCDILPCFIGECDDVVCFVGGLRYRVNHTADRDDRLHTAGKDDE